MEVDAATIVGAGAGECSSSSRGCSGGFHGLDAQQLVLSLALSLTACMTTLPMIAVLFMNLSPLVLSAKSAFDRRRPVLVFG